MSKKAIFLISILCSTVLGITAVHAVEIKPVFPIQTPNDAKSHGLDDLRNAKQSVPKADLSDFLKSGAEAEKAFRQLGKALFWAQEIGSGGKAGKPGQACASCHFHAGADPRSQNQVNPDLLRVAKSDEGHIVGLHNATASPDTTFQTRQPGEKLRFEDFPFVRDINDLDSTNNSNDVVSSQGVLRSKFIRTKASKANDKCKIANDPVFRSVHGKQVRRVEPRNTPTVLNASLNSFFSFWDGRGNPFFNGQNPFGVQDPAAKILVASNGEISEERINVPFSSMASQAIGPPLSDFEMSCGIPEKMNARTWPEIGKKLLRKRKNHPALIPLGEQYVSSTDSVLGDISNYPAKGLNTTYEKLIQKAFNEKYWKAPNLRVIYDDADIKLTQVGRPMVSLNMGDIVTVLEDEEDASDETALPLTEDVTGQKFRLIEANMSLFFGLAVQAYEATLITDNTWFDKWMRTGEFNNGFGENERKGLNVFVGKGKCSTCHGGPEFTNASVRKAQTNSNGFPNNIIQPMLMGDNKFAIYDNGFYNISVTPTHEDIGRGGKGPTNAPLSSSRQRLFDENSIMNIPFPILGSNKIPAVTKDEGEAVCNDVNNSGFCEKGERLNEKFQRVAVDGAFKTPGVREVNLTGPYWHNGAAATLKQVVEFYDNGGNFCKPNRNNLDPDIQPLGLSEEEKTNLVHFLLSLSDPRVALEKAPFDHPSLKVANNGKRNSSVIQIPAIGRKGRAPLNLPPLKPFLGLDQQQVGNAPVNATCSSEATSSTP